jgi:hypothetical protein
MTAPDLHIDEWLRAKENEQLEFNEAKNNFHFERLVKYCAAFANEGVGTSAFQNIARTKAGLVDVHDFLALGLVARSKKIPFALQNRLSRLVELGVVERIARGKIVLSHRLYPSSGPGAAATRKRDAARDQNKVALVRHIIGRRAAGAAMDELRREDAIHPVGTKRNVRWFPGPEPGFGSTSRSEDPE